MKFKVAFLKLTLLLSCCPLINLQAQENYYSKTFTTESGLPHNHVHSIAQDSTGFIWIATWDGLSRYDGYEFKNYYHNPSDLNSIAYFQVYKVLVDFQNNVWVLCGNVISKYNRNTDNFTRFLPGAVGDITVDGEGKIWISSDTGLYRWNYDSNQFENISVQLNTEFESIIKISQFKIAFDNENRLWIQSMGDESHYSRCNKYEKNELKADYIGTLKNYKNAAGNYNTTINFDFFVTPNNCFWIFCNYGIFKFDNKLKQFLPFSDFNVEKDFSGLNKNDIQSAFEKQRYYSTISSDNKLRSKAVSQIIESFLVDRQKTIWQSIITNGYLVKGLTRNIPTSEAFKHYFFEENTDDGLNSIFPVLKDRFGNIWAGPTNINQFFRFDKDGKTSKIIPIETDTWLTARQPRSLIEDSTGIWIGYFYNLLLRYNFSTNKFSKEIFKTSRIEDRSLPLHFVHLKKEGNEIYIFGYSGIYKYNIKSREINQLKLFGLSDDFTLHSCLHDGKTWWVGLSKGTLIHYNNDFEEVERITFGAGNFNIEDIIQGDNNDLWISQLGGGLVHFEKETAKYKIYTTADGLSNNTCYGLLKDKKGNIWISTNHGISRFNTETGKFRVFGPEDGLKIDEFNSDNTYLASDGEMFFGGMGGVVSFYPDSIDTEIEQYKAPLVITDFRVSGASRYFNKAIYEIDSVKLNKGENNFKVTFACLDFVNAAKIKYRYRLRGEEDEFTETDHRNRSVNYANLLPGNYRLEIEATNANGDWVSKTALFIKIPPYYYQTWWFRVLIVFLVVGIIGYIIFTHERQIVLKARQQQDELKLESLRGQMNPHFIFNSLNSINYFISQNDRLAANRYIADFARLIRSILGNLSQEYIPLAKELDSIHDYLQLEHLRFGDKFDYEITVDENVQPDEFMVFPGMVQPFIENAIWHGVRGLEGRKGFVKIRFFAEKPDLLCCVVEDDGIGRKLSEAHKSSLPGKTSRGIGIVLERLKIINHLRKTDFRVTIEDLYPEKVETGTKVSVDIPVKGITGNS